MGPNDETNYIMTIDSKPIEFADFTEDITTELGTKSESKEFAKFGQNAVDGFAAGIKGVQCEFEYKPPKRLRCTTRKRYIKLRMADGVSRNRANLEACVLIDIIGYRCQDAYSWGRWFIENFLRRAEMMIRTMKEEQKSDNE
ncbi:MAG: hypothetical protein LUE89_11205 [Clostridiales bacterium]|nr:hypothetical protein [Clostridiales bacterium]